MKELIFDLGANVGGNIEYYLSKSKKVIALEANPVLCNQIKAKFYSYIKEGRLVIVQACLTLSQEQTEVTFYVNKFDSGASSFCIPVNNESEFYPITVQSISYQDLLVKFGNPEFVKIDLEGYDYAILNYLLQENKLPAYLQFENVGLELLEKIIESGYYKSFNIVSFYNYSKIYKKSHDRNAGPIELDIKSPWLSAQNIIDLYKNLKHTWVDLHLSRENFIEKNQIEFNFYIYEEPFLQRFKLMIPTRLKSKIKLLLKITKE